VVQEASLPGLNEWRRVTDWRVSQLQRMTNVDVYRASPMTATEIVETGTRNVIVATGSTYRRDGIGRSAWRPIAGHDLGHVLTPDDILAGKLPAGRVVIYDDDHYVMGGLLAELCAMKDCAVTLVTPAPLVSCWTQYTLEQARIEARLRSLGVTILTKHGLTKIGHHTAMLIDDVTGTERELAAEGIVLVTDRVPNDALYCELQPFLEGGTLRSLRLVGDAEAPGLIAQAVFSGHLAAREYGEAPTDGTPFAVERIQV
jgi:dimethylamine/trimethylamine dehydrogenase